MNYFQFLYLYKSTVYIVKNSLNLINNNHLIKIGDNWEFFFLENNDFISSPINSYYFTSHDLSINISLRLKWSLYGWFFFKSLSEALDDEEYTSVISFSASINPNFQTMKYDKILLVDEIDMGSFDIFKNQFENEYTKEYYTQNAMVSFKLKLNPSEYIILQNKLFPRIGEYA